jgi:hypothetical protein
MAAETVTGTTVHDHHPDPEVMRKSDAAWVLVGLESLVRESH